MEGGARQRLPIPLRLATEKGIVWKGVLFFSGKVFLLETLEIPETQEALSGDILKGDICKWEFALKLALATRISQ